MNEVSYDRAILMYVLKKGRVVNVGKIVIGAIRMAVNYNVTGLPFPQLLTVMLRAKGVELANESLLFGQPPITNITIRRIMGIGVQQHRARRTPRQRGQPAEQGDQGPPPNQAHVGQVDVLASLMHHMELQTNMITGMQADMRNFRDTQSEYMEYMDGRVSRLEHRIQMVAIRVGVDTSDWEPSPSFPAHFRRQPTEDEEPVSSPHQDMDE